MSAGVQYSYMLLCTVVGNLEVALVGKCCCVLKVLFFAMRGYVDMPASRHKIELQLLLLVMITSDRHLCCSPFKGCQQLVLPADAACIVVHVVGCSIANFVPEKSRPLSSSLCVFCFL